MGVIMGKGGGGAPQATAEPNYVSGPALDYSFMELERIAEALDEEPRAGVLGSKSRLRQVEQKEVKVVATGKKKQKPRVRSRYEVTTITTCLRMNNNSLETLDGLDEAVQEMFDMPEKVEWLDFSFNNLKNIDDAMLKYKDLKSLPAWEPNKRHQRDSQVEGATTPQITRDTWKSSRRQQTSPISTVCDWSTAMFGPTGFLHNNPSR